LHTTIVGTAKPDHLAAIIAAAHKGHNGRVSQSVRSGQARIVLRESMANALQFPVLIAIVLLAVALRVQGSQTSVVYIVCSVGAVLDLLLVRYVLRNRASLAVTQDDITFSRRQDGGAPQQVIHRVDGSTLSFRTAANGPVGSKYTGYVLKLRDNATGHEVFAGAFGRQKVQQACESQGWLFSG
jgi:hypothetical protein